MFILCSFPPWLKKPAARTVNMRRGWIHKVLLMKLGVILPERTELFTLVIFYSFGPTGCYLSPDWMCRTLWDQCLRLQRCHSTYMICLWRCSKQTLQRDVSQNKRRSADGEANSRSSFLHVRFCLKNKNFAPRLCLPSALCCWRATFLSKLDLKYYKLRKIESLLMSDKEP